MSNPHEQLQQPSPLPLEEEQSRLAAAKNAAKEMSALAALRGASNTLWIGGTIAAVTAQEKLGISPWATTPAIAAAVTAAEYAGTHVALKAFKGAKDVEQSPLKNRGAVTKEAVALGWAAWQGAAPNVKTNESLGLASSRGRRFAQSAVYGAAVSAWSTEVPPFRQLRDKAFDAGSKMIDHPVESLAVGGASSIAVYGLWEAVKVVRERREAAATEKNPYAKTPEQNQKLLEKIVAESAPYLDKTTNPEIGDFAVYNFKGTDPMSNAGRALEGQVYKNDWGVPASVTKRDQKSFEKNSEMFLLIDKSDADKPRLAASLRVADGTTGPTETVSFFKESFGKKKPVPQELQAEEPGQKLWDVVAIVADPDYRNGVQSAWLYHALYRKSLEDGVSKWISNVTNREIRNVRDRIGVPFEEVPGVEKATYTSPINNKSTEFGFYSLKVDTIHEKVSRTIADKEARGRDVDLMLASVARMALYGKTTK